MTENMKAVVRTESEAMTTLNGQIVWITRAITKPDQEFDEENLPLFQVVDQRGETHTLFPEELRIAGEVSDAAQISWPMVHIGNLPVTNLHPLVYQTIQGMAANSEPGVIKGTIFIAPGNRSCRVYAIPHRMQPGQSPQDLQERFQQDWTLAAQLDHELKLITLETRFRHLKHDIEGQMGGTFFNAEWTVNDGEQHG